MPTLGAIDSKCNTCKVAMKHGILTRNFTPKSNVNQFLGYVLAKDSWINASPLVPISRCLLTGNYSDLGAHFIQKKSLVSFSCFHRAPKVGGKTREPQKASRQLHLHVLTIHRVHFYAYLYHHAARCWVKEWFWINSSRQRYLQSYLVIRSREIYLRT